MESQPSPNPTALPGKALGLTGVQVQLLGGFLSSFYGTKEEITQSRVQKEALQQSAVDAVL